MGLLHFIFSTLGKCIDFVCLFLDISIIIVNSLVRLFAALVHLIYTLFVLLTYSLLECVNLCLFCIISLMYGVTVLTHNVIGGWMQLLGGVLESCKNMDYLSTRLLLHIIELLHRGLLLGQGFLSQVIEGWGFIFSLLLYLINTVINLLLIGTQNLYAVVLGVAKAVGGPFQKALALALTVLTFVYSSLVGVLTFVYSSTSHLLLTPCRLAVEFVCSVGHLLISVFLLNAYGLLLTIGVILSAVVYLNHRPLQKMASEDSRRTLPSENLPTLLHKQEERKKCVICQDSTKTVLLLPCRHLCLCRDCTDVLLRQPIDKHNCPLCRQMILETMDVYL